MTNPASLFDLDKSNLLLSQLPFGYPYADHISVGCLVCGKVSPRLHVRCFNANPVTVEGGERIAKRNGRIIVIMQVAASSATCQCLIDYLVHKNSTVVQMPTYERYN